MNVFKFEPIYKKRIWGGQQFKTLFGQNLISNEKIGESWNIVDRDEDQSRCEISKGKFLSLRELIEHRTQELMGPNWNESKRFPILVKWLDCQERLSLQVHPPKEVALELHGEPKTENWYVVNATKDAGLFLGFKKGVTKPKFQKALAESNAETLCHRVSSRENDSVFVESGRMHAIDGGNLILEIQQNSDTTYRVYDWGRKGLDGNPRKLHIEESLRSIDFNDFEPSGIQTNTQPGIEIIAECKHFRIRKFNLKKNFSNLLKGNHSDCIILSPIKGVTRSNGQILELGYSYISPYSSDCTILAEEDSSLLITDRFTELVYS